MKKYLFCTKVVNGIELYNLLMILNLKNYSSESGHRLCNIYGNPPYQYISSELDKTQRGGKQTLSYIFILE